MSKSLIIGLIAALILVIFAARNNEIVSVYFLWGNPVKGSLSLVLMISLIIGAVLGLVFSYPSYLKIRKKLNENKKEIERLGTLLEDYKINFSNMEKESNTTNTNSSID